MSETGAVGATDDLSGPIEETRLDPATVQLRQTKSSHWEAPFVFLLFGSQRALLLDTGASRDPADLPLRERVDELVGEWITSHPVTDYELIVAHTHAHGDHIAGDGQFTDRPSTRVVGTTPAEVIAFFGLENWPAEPTTLDLGDRIVDVIPGPGHEPSAVVFFDRATGTLFTGDSICPGRLYIRDRVEFAATIDRLIGFRDSSPVAVEVLRGAHIEMSTTPGFDYPAGTVDQPDEAPLQLPPTILDEIRNALVDAPTGRGRVVRDRFILAFED